MDFGSLNAGMSLGTTQFIIITFDITLKQWRLCSTNAHTNQRVVQDDAHNFSTVNLKRAQQQRGFLPSDIETISSQLRRCAKAKALSDGKRIHDWILKNGLQSDTFLGNLLIQMYRKCGQLSDAHSVFNNIPNPNCFSWSIIIAAYADRGQLKEATMLFQQMPFKDVVTWNVLISAFGRSGQTDVAFQFFQKMFKRNVISWNTMISLFAVEGQLQNALHLFQRMPERNAASWNIMISAYVQEKHFKEAFDMFKQMPCRDVVSWTTMISAYAKQGRPKEALLIFESMPVRNVVSWTALISAFLQQGYVNEALQLFQQMPEKDIVSWNALVSGYAETGEIHDVLQLYEKMQNSGIKPDKITFISVLDACARHFALSEGKQIHREVSKSTFKSDIVVGTALVNMYGKCGNLEEARVVFDQYQRADLIMWNAMISAYAQHGYGREALKLIRMMKLHGLMPDEITFVSFLFACNHVGLFNEGYHFLVSLAQDPGITPGLDHYTCMIDLLGRAGQLDEAEAVADNLPLEPDATCWRTLLSSCKVHGDADRGKRITNNILKLEPGSSAPYILLSNIYSSA